MIKELKKIIQLVQFMTRINIPIKIEFDEEDFGKSIVYLPLIGFLIGIIIYFSFNLIYGLTGNLILSSALVVLIEIIITGGLHLDGLADTFDGVFSYRPKERILEIMKDSRLGTNGALALIILILIKIILIADLNPIYLLFMPIFSRTAMVFSASISNYAREKGMGGTVIRLSNLKTFIIALSLSLFSLLIFSSINLIFSLIVIIIFTFLFTRFLSKKIGGTTGDTLGAVVELTEIIFILTLLILNSNLIIAF